MPSKAYLIVCKKNGPMYHVGLFKNKVEAATKCFEILDKRLATLEEGHALTDSKDSVFYGDEEFADEIVKELEHLQHPHTKHFEIIELEYA